MAGRGWLRSWLESLILPDPPLPRPDITAERATDRAIEDAEAAQRELEQLKRRARAVGISVDVQRSWGPKGD